MEIMCKGTSTGSVAPKIVEDLLTTNPECDDVTEDGDKTKEGKDTVHYRTGTNR